MKLESLALHHGYKPEKPQRLLIPRFIKHLVLLLMTPNMERTYLILKLKEIYILE